MPKRRTLPQECIVCDTDPCICIRKPTKAKVPRPRKPGPEQVPEEVKPEPAPVKPSALDAMRQAAQASVLEQKQRIPLEVSSKTDLTEEDAATVTALRNLGEHFTVEGEAVDKYQRYLKRPADVGERSAAWRARRKGRQD